MFFKLAILLIFLPLQALAEESYEQKGNWDFQAFGGAIPSSETILDDDTHMWFHDDQQGGFTVTIDGRLAPSGIYTEKFTGRKFIVEENGKLIGKPDSFE
jgi:hypothetical protein